MDPAVEAELWTLVEEGDEAARERLILAYRPMVFWLAKKFRVPYSAYPDLIQEGMIGLISAVDNFEAARSNRFITYAYYKVHGRMSNFLSRSEMKAPMPVEDEFLERPYGTDHFERDVDGIEWGLVIREGMETLPKKEYDVVRSLMIEGRRAQEVAAEQGIGVSHVYRLQRKALATLRSWLLNSERTVEGQATS